MDAVANIVFLINVAWLMTHELDAIQQHEWRVFPFLTPFSDIAAYQIFTVLHIPLFTFIMWNLQSPWFWIVFDLFLIVHAGLHWLLRNHPKLEFKNRLSNLLIFGAAPLGLLHLILLQWL
jgi:hypothetical protein